MNNTEIAVFDLELEIINSLAHRYGLAELSRDISALEFRNSMDKISRAARIEEMVVPGAVSSKFG